jgi:cytochrome b subunit of formate dehydrogenase
MDFFQYAQNPWGQEVLVRISWSLFWLAVGAGALFVVGHLVLRQRWIGDEKAEKSAGGDAKIVKHGLAARAFHGVMALSMLVLLATGFLPKIGIQFSWVDLHWIFGVVLIASIVFHILHATFVLSLKSIWISGRDLKDLGQELRHTLGGGEKPAKAGKYAVANKLFHHAATVAGLAAIITGVLMMYRIDNPIFARNPYLYTDDTWGTIYVLHGLGGVALVMLTISHIYFAILPEKRWMTRSMIKGWITRDEYLSHHDPERWDAEPGSSSAAVSDQS